MTMTVTLDPDVAERVEQEAHRSGKSAQAVVNDTLRARLALERRDSPPEPFHVKPHDFRFVPGLDLDRMNPLSDDLEAAAAAQENQGVTLPDG